MTIEEALEKLDILFKEANHQCMVCGGSDYEYYSGVRRGISKAKCVLEGTLNPSNAEEIWDYDGR